MGIIVKSKGTCKEVLSSDNSILPPSARQTIHDFLQPSVIDKLRNQEAFSATAKKINQNLGDRHETVAKPRNCRALASLRWSIVYAESCKMMSRRCFFMIKDERKPHKEKGTVVRLTYPQLLLVHPTSESQHL